MVDVDSIIYSGRNIAEQFLFNYFNGKMEYGFRATYTYHTAENVNIQERISYHFNTMGKKWFIIARVTTIYKASTEQLLKNEYNIITNVVYLYDTSTNTYKLKSLKTKSDSESTENVLIFYNIQYEDGRVYRQISTYNSPEHEPKHLIEERSRLKDSTSGEFYDIWKGVYFKDSFGNDTFELNINLPNKSFPWDTSYYRWEITSDSN